MNEAQDVERFGAKFGAIIDQSLEFWVRFQEALDSKLQLNKFNEGD